MTEDLQGSTADDGRLGQLSPSRRALFEALRAGTEPEPAYRGPATEIERVLCQAWEQVLALPAAGVDDDFFDRGGDSITAVLIVAQAELAGVGCTTRDLFEARTIAKLAPRCVGTDPAPIQHAEPAGTDRYRLTPLQRTILAHSQGGVGYISQLSAELTGELSVAAMRAAWQTVADRHQALRVFVTTEDTVWQQGIAEHVELAVEFVDLSAEPDQDATRARLRREQSAPFDLDTAPLARVLLAKTGPQRWWLLWTHSHLILDGWSEQIIADEVLRLLAGQQLPPADRLTDRLAVAEPDDSAALASWRARLAGAEPTLVGGAGPFAGRAGHRRQSRQLPVATEQALQQLAGSGGTTVAGCLLAAWTLAIAERTGRSDLLLGVTVNGRSSAQTRAVGMFVDTVPLRAELDPVEPFGDFARRLQKRQLDWTPDFPLSLSTIRNAAGLPADVPMFDSIIVVQNFPAQVDPGTELAGLRVESVQAEVDEQFPLLLDVSIRDQTTLTLRWDPERVGASDIDGWLSWLTEFAVPEVAATPVGLLLRRVAALRRSAAGAGRADAQQLLRTATRKQVSR